jgi:hypothetical protein
MGRIFQLTIEHGGLKHLFGQPILNARKTRWLKVLSEYDFEIKHIKGKENHVDETLNRKAHEMSISTISMFKKKN